MQIISNLRFIIFALMLVVGLISTLAAQEIQIEVAEKPLPFLSLEKGEENLLFEVSAVEAIDDEGNFFLAVDDEDARLMIVDGKTGRILKFLSLKGVAPKPKPKWEALARDDEGAYYVVGSHSDTDAAKRKARSRLFRFRLKTKGADASAIEIDESSIIEWSVADAVKSEEKISNPNNAMAKVEGLAVRTLFGTNKKILKRELIIGLREPGSPVRILSGDITTLPEMNATLKLARLFIFNPGTSENNDFRLSSIEYVPFWKGFLILTSTEDPANKFHGNALWFLSDDKITPSKADMAPISPQRIWTFGINRKAEGICVLPPQPNAANSLRAAIVYDNDGETTGISSMFQKIILAGWKK